MFDFKKSIFLGLTILSNSILSNNATQNTTKDKQAKQKPTVKPELEDNNFKKDVAQQFEIVANAIQENDEQNKRANGIVVAHVNELAKKMNLRFEETEKKVLSLDGSVTSMKQDINAIKEKLPKLATTEFVQSTANRIDNLSNRVNDLPTKQWVQESIATCNAKFESLSQEITSITTKKPEPGTLPVIPIDAYDDTSAKKIYTYEYIKKSIDDFNDYQRRSTWSKRQSTINYLSHHKTSVVLWIVVVYLVGDKLHTKYFNNSTGS